MDLDLQGRNVIDLGDDLDPDDVPADWWLERMRLRRDALLAASDWTQAADDPTGNAAAWAAYRQQLRDAPATWTPGPTWTAPETP
jgi:hypothetical protein